MVSQFVQSDCVPHHIHKDESGGRTNSSTFSLTVPPMGSKLLPMQAAGTSVAGFHGTRGDVLVALRRMQPVTAKELAAQFSFTPNALRRHLKALEAEGVVQFRREVRGVGGPVYAYSLTDAGERLFPRAYEPALAAALEVVRKEQGAEGVVRLFERQWAAVAGEIEPTVAALPLAERARFLAELVSSHGYMAEATAQSPTEATIREHNCALRGVAERFPEVCDAEARFFEHVLGAVVERQSHMLAGCNVCEYQVRVRTPDA